MTGPSTDPSVSVTIDPGGSQDLADLLEHEISHKVAREKRSLLSSLRTNWLLAGILLLATICVLHGIRRGEFNLNVDETFHAFTGQYFADLLRAHPFQHPVKFSYEYYAHYPAVEVGQWPPLFYLVEGIAYLLFGRSVLVARLLILAFTLFGLVYWFRLLERLENRFVAATCTLVLALLPFVLLYEKSVMLEIPSLALSIAAIYYWLAYLREDRPRDLYTFAVLAGLALLTKQNAIFLAPFCVLTILAWKKWNLVRRRPLWYALGIVVVIASPFYALTAVMHGREVLAAVEKGSRHISHPWAYYLNALPRQLGWPVLVVAIIGLIISPWWVKRRNVAPMLLWIVSCYLTFNLFAEKDPRYIIYWIPPLVYFAVSVPTSARLPRWLRRPLCALLLVGIGAMAWQAWRFQRPYVSGYRAAARSLMAAKNPGIVLYDGKLNGNFIFFVRKFDPGMRCYVARKLLYVTMGGFSNEQLASNSADIEAILRKYGIKYLVVEQGTRLKFPIQRTLRQLLTTPQFKVEGIFPIESNMARFRNAKLVIYRNLSAAPPLTHCYRVKMLTLPHDIVVPFDAGRNGASAAASGCEQMDR